MAKNSMRMQSAVIPAPANDLKNSIPMAKKVVEKLMTLKVGIVSAIKVSSDVKSEIISMGNKLRSKIYVTFTANSNHMIFQMVGKIFSCLF